MAATPAGFVAAARRGLVTVDEGYDDLRRQALELLDAIKAKLS